MTQPPILPYKTPDPDQPNTPKKFLGRMALGAGLGTVAMFAGGILVAMTNQALLFWLPPAAALILAIYIALHQRRYGYVTGVILAPFFIVLALGTLALIICGGIGLLGIR